MSRLFGKFSKEMKARPVPMYWEGRGSICVKLGDQKSTAVFQHTSKQARKCGNLAAEIRRMV